MRYGKTTIQGRLTALLLALILLLPNVASVAVRADESTTSNEWHASPAAAEELPEIPVVDESQDADEPSGEAATDEATGGGEEEEDDGSMGPSTDEDVHDSTEYAITADDDLLSEPDIGSIKLELFSQDGQMEMLDVPMESFSETLGSFGPAPTFSVQKLRNNGPDSENMVLVFMGDGFTASQQDEFINQASIVSDEILATHPFSSFQDAINIYAIQVISNQSGASRDPDYNSPIVDNYFGSSFWFDGLTQRLLSTPRLSRVFEVLNSHLPGGYDMPVLLVNTTTYGGAGGSIAVSSITPGAAGPVTVHELGHSFGGLADEYWWVEGNGGGGGEHRANRTQVSDRNMDTTQQSTTDLLKHFGAEGISLYRADGTTPVTHYMARLPVSTDGVVDPRAIIIEALPGAKNESNVRVKIGILPLTVDRVNLTVTEKW